jgi:hypothetical protein
MSKVFTTTYYFNPFLFDKRSQKLVSFFLKENQGLEKLIGLKRKTEQT